VTTFQNVRTPRRNPP